MTREYTATYWRSMPQLEGGGYETDRVITARSRDHAERIALKRARKTLGYRDMRLLRVERTKKIEEKDKSMSSSQVKGA